MLAADRSRSAGRVGGSAGSVLRSLRKLWEGWGFRAVREGLWCSLPRLAADRSRSAGVCGGLRGIGPARAEEAQGRIGLSRCALGILVFASKACSGPIPLRLAYGGRSAGSVLRSLRKLWEGLGFRAVREGFLVIASKARSGPIPLPLGVGWVFWEADVRRLRGGSRVGVVGDGAWLGGVLAVSTVPHGVF
jgi:hypothetical protein